jgi:hypothetical protein
MKKTVSAEAAGCRMGTAQGAKREILAHMTSTVWRAGAPVGFALLLAVASAQGPWKVLFDGKDLSNFTIEAGRRGAPPAAPDAPPGWHVQNGFVIGGEPKPGERSGSMATKEKYFDFEFELDFLLGEIAGVKCSEERGPKEESLSDPACLGNSGVTYRRGYQVNIGRREGGEYIGLVIHRVDPKATRGNILWLSYGDRAFPNLRKSQDWNTLRIAVKGDRHQAWLNGTKVVDVMDKSTLETEAGWRQPQPLSVQSPYTPGVTIKIRNFRARTL